MRFKFIDLFAGIGGMRLGFEDAGGACTLTCEINAHALATYKANYAPKHEHMYFDDILRLDSSFVPDHDVLVAGFPCQPYSIAGLRKGLKDERGGDIFLAILRILASKKPTAFLLENVKGIMNHDKGQTFKFMLDSLSKCGYTVQHRLLNTMLHANVPQNRERVFVVGFRDDIDATKFVYPNEIARTCSIQDCLETKKVDDKYYYTHRYDCYEKIAKSITSRDVVYQWRRQYVRANKSNVCPTLTANMGSGGHNVPLILDAYGIRKLTPRETANFQGFPRTFVLPKISDSKLYHQFGNSVTVPLISKIAHEIAKFV